MAVISNEVRDLSRILFSKERTKDTKVGIFVLVDRCTLYTMV